MIDRRVLLSPVVRQLRRVESIRSLARAIRSLSADRNPTDFRAAEVAQASLVAQWKALADAGVLLDLADVGFQNFSEFEEDGVLLYLFTILGTTNRTVVEIASQDGRICMASNLIVHHRWTGHLYDGDPIHVRSGQRFFAKHPATRSFPPKLSARWFDRRIINDVLREDGVPPEIDLLSLDLDGIDLYLWDALTWTRPRVLICEFNNVVPIDRALTVPYEAAFKFSDRPPAEHLFRSASLKAYQHVSAAKGYRYIGCNALGFNAYFLRNDVGANEFAAADPQNVDELAFTKETRAKNWPQIAALPWVDLDTDEGRSEFTTLRPAAVDASQG
jgi:hypothetical protein